MRWKGNKFSMNDDWYCKIADRESGPLSSDEVRFLLDRGKLAVKDEVRLGKEGKWRTIGSVEALKTSKYSTTRPATGSPQPGPVAIPTPRVSAPPPASSSVSEDHIVASRESDVPQENHPPIPMHFQNVNRSDADDFRRQIAIGAGIGAGIFFMLLLLLVLLLWAFSSGGGKGTGNGDGIGSGSGTGEGSGTGSGSGGGSGNESGDGSGQGSQGETSPSPEESNSPSQTESVPEMPPTSNTLPPSDRPVAREEPPKEEPSLSLFIDPRMSNPQQANRASNRGQGMGGGGGGGGGDFEGRLKRAGAKTGDVQISLLWNNFNDIDLHVICPSGARIFFGTRRSACGGELDVDMNAGGPQSNKPVENIYWPHGQAPQGRYQVYVHHYANHGGRDPTYFSVRVKVDGKEKTFKESLTFGAPPKLIYTFER
jgi:hypothetical protein